MYLIIVYSSGDRSLTYAIQFFKVECMNASKQSTQVRGVDLIKFSAVNNAL